jgi:hypothetical protein
MTPAGLIRYHRGYFGGQQIMKPGDVVIAAIWALVLAQSLYRGIVDGRANFSAPDPPLAAAAFIWLLFFLFSAIVPFLSRRNFAGRAEGFVMEWIEQKWGAGTCVAIVQRFKPFALMSSFGLTYGIAALISNYANEQSWPEYFISGFFLSVGLGLLAAYALSLRFPPRMY